MAARTPNSILEDLLRGVALQHIRKQQFTLQDPGIRPSTFASLNGSAGPLVLEYLANHGRTLCYHSLVVALRADAVSGDHGDGQLFLKVRDAILGPAVIAAMMDSLASFRDSDKDTSAEAFFAYSGAVVLERGYDYHNQWFNLVMGPLIAVVLKALDEFNTNLPNANSKNSRKRKHGQTGKSRPCKIDKLFEDLRAAGAITVLYELEPGEVPPESPKSSWVRRTYDQTCHGLKTALTRAFRKPLLDPAPDSPDSNASSRSSPARKRIAVEVDSNLSPDHGQSAPRIKSFKSKSAAPRAVAIPKTSNKASLPAPPSPASPRTSSSHIKTEPSEPTATSYVMIYNPPQTSAAAPHDLPETESHSRTAHAKIPQDADDVRKSEFSSDCTVPSDEDEPAASMTTYVMYHNPRRTTVTPPDPPDPVSNPGPSNPGPSHANGDIRLREADDAAMADLLNTPTPSARYRTSSVSPSTRLQSYSLSKKEHS